MKSPKEDQKMIYSQLVSMAKIINPTNDKFTSDLSNPICPERDRLIGIFYEYMAYSRWFKQREQQQ